MENQEKNLHSIGQLEHPFGAPGYCELHKVLGCEKCAGVVPQGETAVPEN